MLMQPERRVFALRGSERRAVFLLLTCLRERERRRWTVYSLIAPFVQVHVAEVRCSGRQDSEPLFFLFETGFGGFSLILFAA